MGKLIDLTGQKFGRLTVIEKAESKGKSSYWLCKCDCGNYVSVKSWSLRSGRTKSCGCLNNELREQFVKSLVKHGDAKRKGRSKLYGVWGSMMRRTRNENDPAYKNYGGRGIFVCDDWQKYENFRDWALENGYKEGLTIERIDVNKGYCPENCCWIPKGKQSNNTRRTIVIEFNGKKQNLAEWSMETGIAYTTLFNRIKKGWSVEDALTTPPRTRRKQKG